MSDLGRATAALTLGDEDEACGWYRCPIIDDQAYPRLPSGRESGLCGECTSLSQEILGALQDASLGHNGPGATIGFSPTRTPQYQGYTFHKSYSQLRGDANSCALCRVIEDSIGFNQRYAAGHNFIPIPPDNHLYLEPKTYDMHLDGLSIRVAEDENASETDSEISSSDDSHGGFKSNPKCKGFLEVEARQTERVHMVDNISPSDEIKGGDAVNILESSFPKAVPLRDMTQILHSWLRECDSVHVVCREHNNTRRSSTSVEASAGPTRLLEIQKVNGRLHVHLVENNEIRHRYTALSHRWGGYESSRTTTANIERYRNEIKFDSLPPTLRQAMQITHAAGVHHIWADCLCIIQNDDNDWAQEAPKMGSIYANAYFTIAASAFVDEGCFPLKFADEHRVTIDIHPGIELNVFPRSSDFNMWAIEHEPLQKRGWTLQERLLSQRILYCSRYEYYWLCREQRLRAWGNPGRWFAYGSVLPAIRNPVVNTKSTLLLSSSTQSRRAALTQWYMLLFDYSNRQLTLEKDKLIAIHGLVDMFQRWIGSRFLHGLWECDLACGLLWHPGSHWCNTFSDSDSEREIMSFKPDRSRFWRKCPGRAPSWSWASMDGYHNHQGAILGMLEDCLGQPCSEIACANVTIASDDEHRSCLGVESSGDPQVLKIRGKLSKAFCDYESAAEQDKQLWWIDRDGGFEVFYFIADDPDFDITEHTADAEDSKLYVLPIICHMGLVVTPTSDSDLPLYRRVGTSNFLIPLYTDVETDNNDISTAGNANDGAQAATVHANNLNFGLLNEMNEGITKDGARDLLNMFQWLKEIGISQTLFLY